MITVEELVYEFKLMINKVNRQDNVDIPVEDVIVYLNRAQMSWIKTKINPNNIYKVGYEAIEKRIDDLQVLKQPAVRLTPTKTNDLFYLGYSCPLEDAANYMFYVNSVCVAKQQDCKKNLTIHLIKQGDLNNMYLDANLGPSFSWRSTLATIGDNKLFVYTDGSFSIENVLLTYLRYPKNIDIEGYTKLDGTTSQNVNCELPEYAKGDIVDLAVKFAAQSNDNQTQAIYAEDRLVKNSE